MGCWETSHTSQMQQMCDELMAQLEGLAYRILRRICLNNFDDFWIELSRAEFRRVMSPKHMSEVSCMSLSLWPRASSARTKPRLLETQGV